MKTKIAIIGGGPAGLSAAVAARKAGVEDILILERDEQLGGILNQCIHKMCIRDRIAASPGTPAVPRRLILIFVSPSWMENSSMEEFSIICTSFSICCKSMIICYSFNYSVVSPGTALSGA